MNPKNNTPTPQKEVVSSKKLHLTKDIKCKYCGAKPGEPCKIQPPVDYKGNPLDTIPGNSKTFNWEVVHICRAK